MNFLDIFSNSNYIPVLFLMIKNEMQNFIYHAADLSTPP